MASKRKAIASNQSKTRNATSKQTKNKVWTEEEVTTYANVLCSTDNAERSWLYQIENYALKKSANEELFRRIKDDFDIAMGHEEGDETFTTEKLRAKFKWFKRQWRIIDCKIKNGTGLGAKDTAVPSWYDIMNPHFCEAADDMTSVSSKASDIDTTLDSSDSENHSNPESSDEGDSFSDTNISNKKRHKPADEKSTLNTSSQGPDAGESETIVDAREVEQGGKDTGKSKKKSPTKKTKIIIHPKKLLSKPRSQSEAMIQVAKSIESSTKEQEKNRDERLKILLDVERKRDELFYAHQREQAEANRKHEILLAQLLSRGSSTPYPPQFQNHQVAHSSNTPVSYGYSPAENQQPESLDLINTSSSLVPPMYGDNGSYSFYKL